MTETEKSQWNAADGEGLGAPTPARARPWLRLPEETGVIVALIVMIAVIDLAKPRQDFVRPEFVAGGERHRQVTCNFTGLRSGRGWI